MSLFGFHTSKKTLLPLAYACVDYALVDSFPGCMQQCVHAVRWCCWWVADTCILNKAPNLIVYQMHVPANHQQHRRTAWMHCCSLGSCRPARHWHIHSPVVRVSSCFLLSLSVKEFLKSVKIWQSYCQSLGASFFWNMVYMTWSSKPFEN